jgi:hypothetical protein
LSLSRLTKAMSIPSRVSFRERQLLRAGDLQAEQQYLLGLAGRHHVAPHTWGIVRGLSLSLQGNVATVQPGLAIDGYGRELAVFEAHRIPLDQQRSSYYVYLYYCERPKGACGTAPNPRFQDSAEVGISSAPWPVPGGDPDLTSAAAAGSIAGAAPWPVLLGVIKARKNNVFHVHYSPCVYTQLRASSVCAPAGGAIVRIGAENLADPYSLRISLRDSARNLQRRFAVDLDGNLIFWGNLILTGAERGAVFPTQKKGLFVNAQAKSSAGGAVRVQFDLSTPGTLALRFRVASSALGSSKPDVLKLDDSASAKQVKEAIKAFNKTSSSVHLQEILEVKPRKAKKIVASEALFAAPATPPPAPPIFDDRDLPLEFSGADFLFAPEEVPALPPCDCLTPVDNPELLPEGLIFLPGTAAPAPPGREIYSLHLEPKGELPSDEVRIGGGVKKDGDFSRHISVSGQFDDTFVPLLAFRGNGSLALPGDLSTAGLASHLLCVVGGTTQLPVVKPDPRDPLFNYLLVLAFIQGVMSGSSQLVKVDFPGFPTFFETHQTLEYSFTLQNLSTNGLLKHDKCSETIITNSLAVFGSVSFAGILLPYANPTSVPVSHPAGQLPAGATSLQIEIDVSMKLGDLSVAGKKRSPTVPILQSPAPDFSHLVDHIQVGHQFHVGVVNPSGVDLVLTQASLTRPGATQNLLAGNLLVPAGQTIDLPLQPTVNGSGGPAVRFTLAIAYHWIVAGSPTSDRPLTFDKTVVVG